jgi:Acyclic terpene utilisation family protein AtuA
VVLTRCFSTGATDAYEKTFLSSLEPVLPEIAKRGIKVAANAGSSNTKALYDALVALLREKMIPLNVAWVDGDQVLDTVKQILADKSSDLQNLCTGQRLEQWKHEPISAQCYLGGLGVAEAFKRGVDIVVCGRVADASPVIGTAVWWHEWSRTDFDQLANSLIAGHLIECSSYVCGGNFTGFKALKHSGWEYLGLPIAEIGHSGQVTITKTSGSNGLVTIDTCKSQLLYEIQGPRYYNSDVTAFLEGVAFEQVGQDRVLLRGIRGGPPPATTKVGITAKESYHVEVFFWLVGLDVEEKAQMLEAQVRKELGPRVHNLNLLEFTLVGRPTQDPVSQLAATVGFRLVAQASKEIDLEASNFLEPVLSTTMELYPGGTFHMDVRTGFPRPIYEYFVAKLPQSLIKHRVHFWDGQIVPIAHPTLVEGEIRPLQQVQPLTSLDYFGPTTRGPLGWVVHSRSGDKGSNANVGFYVRHEDEYEWLRALLTVEKVKELLAQEYRGGRVVSYFFFASALVEYHKLTLFLSNLGAIRAAKYLGSPFPSLRPP